MNNVVYYNDVEPVIKVIGYKVPSNLKDIKNYRIVLSNGCDLRDTLREHVIPLNELFDVFKERCELYKRDNAKDDSFPSRIYVTHKDCSMCLMFERFEAEAIMPDSYAVVYRFREVKSS